MSYAMTHIRILFVKVRKTYLDTYLDFFKYYQINTNANNGLVKLSP